MDKGVKFINDVSGMEYDSKMIDVISEYNAGIVVQHSTGLAENVVKYTSLVDEVYKFLYDKVTLLKSKGVENIILDVGIGFGKTREDNFELLDRIEEFKSLGQPLMVGISRKSLLGVQDDNNELKDSITFALNLTKMR